MSGADPRASSPLRFDVGGGEPLELSGWDGVSNDAAERMAALEEERRLNRATIYRRCFTSDVGRYVLQDMISNYLGRQIVIPDQDPKADGIRQGEVNVVGEILSLIEFANTGGGRPPDPTE